MTQTSAVIRLPDWMAAWPMPAGRVSDEEAMKLAVAFSRENAARGTGGPFGAVIRSEPEGKIAAVGVNLVPATGIPVFHAEVTAITLAGRALDPRQPHTLFSSCEPCIMCLGASHWAGIVRIVSAALREDAEGIGFAEGSGVNELRAEMAGRGVKFESGLLREEAAKVLRNYRAGGGRMYGPAS
ncbi:MAG TPA: nucleoside deaminase [Hyphomonadaceae bacterium]|nr:nucleoside deaminase [Hyphomonadaceae bacterium]